MEIELVLFQGQGLTQPRLKSNFQSTIHYSPSRGPLFKCEGSNHYSFIQYPSLSVEVIPLEPYWKSYSGFQCSVYTAYRRQPRPNSPSSEITTVTTTINQPKAIMAPPPVAKGAKKHKRVKASQAQPPKQKKQRRAPTPTSLESILADSDDSQACWVVVGEQVRTLKLEQGTSGR